MLKKQDAAAASASKRQHRSFGSTSTNDGADESVADLTVAGLRAYEETSQGFDKVFKEFNATYNRVELEAGCAIHFSASHSEICRPKRP